MSVQLTGDVGKGVGGLGKFIFYGTLAYIVYRIYKGSSLSYFGMGKDNYNWKPMSHREIQSIRILSER